MFGNHIWQSGAHKSVDEARLDVTHFENLTDEQKAELEKRCNEVVLEDHPVEIKFMPRDEAERKFGFRLYQGGVVPGKIIRVVNTTGVDVEACGGLHCDRTSRVGPIRILRTKRIQDGVVRIEYSAGLAAVAGMQADKACVDFLADNLQVTRETVIPAIEKLQAELKRERKEREQLNAQLIEKEADQHRDEAVTIEGIKVIKRKLGQKEDPLGLIKQLTSQPGTIVIVGYGDKMPKLAVARSSELTVDCRIILKEMMKILGGGGGGKPDLAIGGGGDPGKMDEAMERSSEIFKAALAKK
jgi:alanyl-tRNA synthetase